MLSVIALVLVQFIAGLGYSLVMGSRYSRVMFLVHNRVINSIIAVVCALVLAVV